MKIRYKLIGILGLLFLAINGQAQDTMSLQDALKEALSQNYSVKVAQNNEQISKNQATLGNAGLLPNVSASGAFDYGNDNVQLALATNPNDIIKTTGAQSTLASASLNLNYTIFSGGSNKTKYKQLGLNADLSTAQGRINAEAVILEVASAYYNVQRSHNNYEALTKTYENSQSRLDRAIKQRELSGGSKLNELNAKVDLYKDSVNLITAKQALQDVEVEFNRLLARDLSAEVKLETSNNEIEMLEFETLKKEMLQQNNQLHIARLNQQNSVLDYKISKSAYSPTLNLNSSYAFSKSDAEGSFLVLNQSNGFGATLSLSIPIYSGGQRSVAVENRRIQQETRELELQDTELKMKASLLKAYRNYVNNSNLLKLEEENVRLNKENFEYARKQYEMGLLNNTDYRQAQINLLLTENNLSNVRYNYKLSELELLRLSGRLISSNK